MRRRSGLGHEFSHRQVRVGPVQSGSELVQGFDGSSDALPPVLCTAPRHCLHHPGQGFSTGIAGGLEQALGTRRQGMGPSCVAIDEVSARGI